jgi:hypothetical protein
MKYNYQEKTKMSNDIFTLILIKPKIIDIIILQYNFHLQTSCWDI